MFLCLDLFDVPAADTYKSRITTQKVDCNISCVSCVAPALNITADTQDEDEGLSVWTIMPMRDHQY